MTERVLWIDISNTPQVQFFGSLVRAWKNDPRLAGTRCNVTLREKNETVPLARLRGLDGKVIGRDYEDSLRKSGAMVWRTASMAMTTPRFDIALSFENPMPIPIAAVRRKPYILMLDNDVKFDNANLGQRIETRLKAGARHLIVPEAMRGSLGGFAKADITYYAGTKEHVHIHGFSPPATRPAGIPFEDYVVVRPEALESLYVKEDSSLTPALVTALVEAGIPVVLLGRADIPDHPLIHRPKTTLDGLHVLFFARAVLTGSGTMAREGSALGIPAVSFFPGRRLLAVDQDLVKQGKIFHSRDIRSIVEFILARPRTTPRPEFKVAADVVETITNGVQRLAR